MDVHHQFVAPSQCSDSLSCHFTNPDKPNLIVAKHTVLQVFDILEDKLVLVAEYQLSGVITGMAKVRTLENDKLDYLVVATKFAKLSVIRWNFHTHSISTVSLHYYEPQMEALSLDKIKTARFRCDPNGLVACVESDGVFAMLPFEQDAEDDDMDEGEKKSKAEQSKSAVRKLNGSSFLIDAKKLESSIATVVDFVFLHSYREPTVAVLHASSPVSWAGHLPRVKDNLKLSVLSLDLESKSATTIIEASNLPFDIDTAVALPAPLNGTLLLGANEIIHVNSLGSLRGITVNGFGSKCSNLQLKDQSSLDLRMEGAVVVHLFEDKVLLMTAIGELFVCVFERMGSTSSISMIYRVPPESYQGIIISHPRTATVLPNNQIFVVCHGGESVLMSWKYGSEVSGAVTEQPKLEETDKKDDDDDFLYDEDDTLQNDGASSTNGSLDLSKLQFFRADALANFGPLTNFTIGKISTTPKFFGLANPNLNEDCIVGCSGVGRAGCLSVFHPTVQPIIKSTLKFSSINRMWTLNDRNGRSHFLVTSDYSNYKTQIFLIDKNYREFASKEFNTKEITVAIATVGNPAKHRGVCIVQVTSTNVFLYDFKFRKLQTISYDEEITFAQISEHGYAFITRENGDIDVLEFTETMETIEEAETSDVPEPPAKKPRRGRRTKKQIEEEKAAEDTKLAAAEKAKPKQRTKYSLEKINLPMLLSNTIIVSGCITTSKILHKVKIGEHTLERKTGPPTPCFFLVTADNRILVFDKDHGQKIFELNTAEQLTEYLSVDLMMANKEGVPDPFFKQIMVTQIGDEHFKDEYLIVLTMGGELLLYKVFFDEVEGVCRLIKMNEQCRMPITGAPDNAYAYGTHIERRLVKVDTASYSAVFVTGVTPYCIWRSHNSNPRVFQFTAKPALAFGGFTTDKVPQGVMFIDDSKNARICELDTSFDYTNTVPVKQIPIGKTLKNVVYHKSSNTYMVSTIEEAPFVLTDFEGDSIPTLNEDVTAPVATSLKGSLQLISPTNWSVIDQVEFDSNEVAMSVKALDLDVVRTSSMVQFKDRREIIVAGTGIFSSESNYTNGSLNIYDIIPIVPEPGRPEANFKLKQIYNETRKGCVVTVTDVSGRILAVQGQRAFVWNLKDDNNTVPVAFVDTGIWTTETKSFENLILFGDTQQSISLVGFEAEPYRIVQLGKDALRVDVLAADFVVNDGNLFILAADADQMLHILQYDPEDPKSHQGHTLIRKSIFRNNASTTNMLAVSRARSLFSASQPLKEAMTAEFECIGSNVDGSLYRVTPVSEATYRRLYAIQQQIFDRESHFLGLNPRLNMVGHVEHIMSTVNRPVLDFNVLKKYFTLSEDRKRAFAKRIGNNVYSDIYRDFIGIS